MANAEKKAKAEPAPKKETPSKETPSKDKSAPAADAPKTADASKSDTSSSVPKNYSRGEGQKPVTQAYKDNWNAIFGKKKRR
jgi:hypothetical protein